MKSRDDEISAFEAKTHLSELLRDTEQGRSFVIYRRGKPVARRIRTIPAQCEFSLVSKTPG